MCSTFDNDQNTLLLNDYFLLDATATRPIRHGMEVFVDAGKLTGQRYDLACTLYLPQRTIHPISNRFPADDSLDR